MRFPPKAFRALTLVRDLVAEHSLAHARLVRCVWFSKDDGSNWSVPWHQDRVIAVQDRADVAGFSNWSNKAGVWHCEPPVSVFDSMRFVRLHLDDCDAQNGAMEIAVGSHNAGAVPMGEAESAAQKYPASICVAKAGDVQILPMMTLHRSRPALLQAPRRAIRLDFANAELPAPLTWIDLLEETV